MTDVYVRPEEHETSEPPSWSVYNRASFVVETTESDEIELNVYVNSVPQAYALISLQPLNKSRMPLENHPGYHQTLVRWRELHISVESTERVRAVQALNCQILQTARIRWRLPAAAPDVAYFLLSVTPLRANGDEAPESDRMLVERRKGELGMGKKPGKLQYGFLSTQHEVNARILEIHRYGTAQGWLNVGKDANSGDTLRELFFRLYAGHDTILLQHPLAKEIEE